jgi:protein disulfide-isomerase A6
VPGGLLSEQAGRISSLDDIAKIFLSTPTAKRSDLVKQATDLASNIQNYTGQYYLKVMEKLGTSSDYLQTESGRLGKILEKRATLAGKKLDELQIKQNILKAFQAVQNKAQEGADDVDEIFERAKEEL